MRIPRRTPLMQRVVWALTGSRGRVRHRAGGVVVPDLRPDGRRPGPTTSSPPRPSGWKSTSPRATTSCRPGAFASWAGRCAAGLFPPGDPQVELPEPMRDLEPGLHLSRARAGNLARAGGGHPRGPALRDVRRLRQRRACAASACSCWRWGGPSASWRPMPFRAASRARGRGADGRTHAAAFQLGARRARHGSHARRRGRPPDPGLQPGAEPGGAVHRSRARVRRQPQPRGAHAAGGHPLGQRADAARSCLAGGPAHAAGAHRGQRGRGHGFAGQRPRHGERPAGPGRAGARWPPAWTTPGAAWKRPRRSPACPCATASPGRRCAWWIAMPC